MFRLAITLAVAALLVAPTFAQQETQPQLKLGDPAPPLVVEKWLKGTPIKAFEPGSVYVVEFWATWCGPCIVNMPHLSALQKEYQDKHVTIVGVNIWERSYSDETLAAVQKFVQEQGDKMAYTVAYDGSTRVMDRAYMEATGSRGIPTAFVVDQKGRVAWFGHPNELEFVLAEVVDGSYDIQTGSLRLKKFQELMGAIFEKLQDSPKDALTEFRQLEREFPKQAAKNAQLKEYLLLGAGEHDEAYQLMRTRAQQLIANKDAMGLNDLAWTIVDPESDLAKRDLVLALEAATKSAEFTNFENAAVLDTLAMAHFRQGNLDEAIKFQTKAVEAAPAGIKEELTERLEEFKTARAKR